MSNSNNDMDRYFSDPEYRRNKVDAQKEASTQSDSSGFEKTKTWYQNQTNTFKYGTAAAGVIVLLFIAFFIYLYQGLPSIKELENPKTASATLILSRDGVVLDKYFTENRTYVPIKEISPYAVEALIATEDHRFYDHWGIDMVRTLAIPYHLMQGEVEGGSTLTQQLARNLYKKIGRDFSVVRKLREMITAIDIEQNYTKREIIELYLNTVEFPNSAFGIETASQTHYGKPAKDLTLTESAMLVGSVNAVYAYNPRLFPERAMSRRNVVLSQMNKRGLLSNQAFTTLRQDSIKLDYHPPSKSSTESRYFGQYIRQTIENWAKENNYNLDTDGLTIHTTIDSRLQEYAQQAVEEKLDSLQVIFEDEWTSTNGEYMDQLWEKYPRFLKSFIRETNRYKNGFSKYDTKQESVVFDSLLADKAYVDSLKRARTKLEAGFVAIDPNNGNIRAWIGGSNYGSVQYDHVFQSRRQTGSTFKPFVYAVAIDNGYKPYHKLSKYPSKFYDRSGRVWDPKDPSIPEGPEMISLRQGLARSLNNITVGLLPEIAGAPETTKLEDLQPAARKIKQMASNFGIDMSNTPAYPSIALGTAQASLLELVSAYTTFANEGVHVDPIAITRIEDKQGNIVKEYQDESRQEVISPETAYMMVDMLRGVIRGGEDYYGTGVRLRATYNVQQDVAGKTGTTQNAADNWFVAMMPHLVMGAWVGGEDRRIRFPTWSRTGQGAHTALPMVGQFIKLASSDPDVNWSKDSFKSPPGFVMPEAPEEGANSNWQNNQRIDW
jgi:penicillin-binding protein 1A